MNRTDKVKAEYFDIVFKALKICINYFSKHTMGDVESDELLQSLKKSIAKIEIDIQ